MTNTVSEVVSLGAGCGDRMVAPRSPQGVCELKVGERSCPNMQIHTHTHSHHAYAATLVSLSGASESRLVWRRGGGR